MWPVPLKTLTVVHNRKVDRYLCYKMVCSFYICGATSPLVLHVLG